MSQEKVEKYKQEKVHRKENVEKAKRKKKREKLIAWIVAIVLCAGIGAAVGVTLYNEYQAQLAARPNYERDEMILSDLTGVLEESEEAAEETAAETEAAEETAAETEAAEETAAETEAAEETAAETEAAEETAAESAGEEGTSEE